MNSDMSYPTTGHQSEVAEEPMPSAFLLGSAMPSLENHCPAKGRNGRHELYIGGPGGKRSRKPGFMCCEACGANGPMEKIMPETRSIADMVKDGKRATLEFYRDGLLWYTTECGFEFPVPISDTKGATFNASEKAMTLMKYIRKHLKRIETGDDSEII